jgi:hypothetical protein
VSHPTVAKPLGELFLQIGYNFELSLMSWR